MTDPLFRKVDCVLLRVPDLDEALAFYGTALGHRLIWRNDEAAGLAMGDGDTKLVLHTTQDSETDLLVDDVPKALDRVIAAGGELIVPPFDLPVGRLAVVRDPFGNALTLIDLSKGNYLTNAAGQVTGIVPSISKG